MESVASGLIAALAVNARARGIEFLPPPRETMLGSLLGYLREESNARPQPMNVNFGLLPPLDEPVRNKKLRRLAHVERAAGRMLEWAESLA